jgi:alkanesulfonate monooxygenase SsuD/methylene tetrahydromethanopterin reductase-like flavin-dependent oxidoreductase (luciferase family)
MDSNPRSLSQRVAFSALITWNSLTITPPHFRLGSIPYASRESPTELAVALEERGFDSLWVAEHSHIPVSRRFSHPQGEAALTKEYFDVMDPFVTLSAAAAVTTRLKLGTAV